LLELPKEVVKIFNPVFKELNKHMNENEFTKTSSKLYDKLNPLEKPTILNYQLHKTPSNKEEFHVLY
jgi:hypothetical protein